MSILNFRIKSDQVYRNHLTIRAFIIFYDVYTDLSYE